MYRPQFVYPDAYGVIIPAKDGKPAYFCQDKRCTYSFDYTNTPSLSVVNNNVVNLKIPLILDQDADFFLRAFQVNYSTVGGVGTQLVQVGLLDCFNNQILDPLVAGNPPVLYPYLWSESATGGIVTLDSDAWGIYCPAGGALGAYVNNQSGATASVIINLHGVKRYRGAQCF